MGEINFSTDHGSNLHLLTQYSYEPGTDRRRRQEPVRLQGGRVKAVAHFLRAVGKTGIAAGT